MTARRDGRFEIRSGARSGADPRQGVTSSLDAPRSGSVKGGLAMVRFVREFGWFLFLGACVAAICVGVATKILTRG